MIGIATMKHRLKSFQLAEEPIVVDMETDPSLLIRA